MSQQNITDLFIQIVTSNVNIVNNSFITLSQATNFSKRKKRKKKVKKLDTVKNIFQVQYDCQHVCHISYV